MFTSVEEQYVYCISQHMEVATQPEKSYQINTRIGSKQFLL